MRFRTLLASLTLLAISAPAGAIGISVLHCDLDKPIMDFGVSVDIVSYKTLTATLQEFTIMGPRNKQTYAVKRLPQVPGRMGQPTIFKGKDFLLTVCTDCAPVNGKSPATLVAQTDYTTKLNERMLCTFTR